MNRDACARAWVASFASIACTAALILASCACAERNTSTQSAARVGVRDAVVTGTCINAETGEVLRGVEIQGPHGTHAVSGADGRFELRGLAAGDQGEIVASDKHGRRRVLPLRPLAGGVLEVVVHL